jgi:glycosyltransferase involved in cell wall biosynthesis
MKTINFLTSHFLPENTACTNRVLSYVTELQKYYKINIITLTEKGILKNEKNLKVKYSDNIDIYYINQYDFNGKNFFIRAFNEIKYLTRIIKLSNKLDASTVICTAPYMFMIPIVSIFSNKNNILDLRDLVWEYLSGNNFVNKTIKYILTYIMKFSIKRFKNVIVTNDYEYKKLTTDYKIYTPIIIPNGIDIEKFNQLSKIEFKNSEFTVTYVGNIGLAQNLLTLINAAKQLPKVKFNVIGDGTDFERIKEEVKTAKLSNINLTGKLDWDKLSNYYSNTSILYAQLDSNFKSAMPSKLYEYASIGLPIIYGGVGQASLFVNELENALYISPNNVDKLVNAIHELQTKDIIVSQKNKDLIFNKFIREKTILDIYKILNTKE